MGKSPHSDKENMSNSQADPITPLHDTWRWQKYIGSWLISSPFDKSSHTTEEISDWFAKQLKENFTSFNQWTRVWKVKIAAHYPKTKEVFDGLYQWDGKQCHKDFMNDVFQEIQGCPALISGIEAHVDMLVYTRTEQSPLHPVRAWIRENAFFRITSSGSMGFHIYMTLFCRYSPDLDDNEELYNLNHPILSASLQDWEKQYGEINADDGRFGMYPHGFLPDWT